MKTVRFAVSGNITLKSALEIRSAVTIDGTGQSVCVRTDGSFVGPCFNIANTSGVTLRNLRVRPGPTIPGVSGENTDAIALTNVQNVLIEHCSLSWSVDELLQLWQGCSNITIRDCILSEALYLSTHPLGIHSCGCVVGGGGNGAITFHRCLFAHNNNRNPEIYQGRVDYINNVVYDWGLAGGEINNEQGDAQVNQIGNYYKAGQSSDGRKELVVKDTGSGYAVKVYREGNHHSVDGATEWGAVVVDPASATADKAAFQQATAFPALDSISPLSADDAFAYVLANAGAFPRDAVDRRIVADVQAGTGALINDPEAVGGWPVLTK